MKRLIVLAALVGAGAASMAVVSAQPTLGQIQIERVRDNLYVIVGGRQGAGIAGNTTVFIAESGVVLIDTKYAGFGKAILDQVKAVTTKPVTTIINTHTHGDHTGGNPEFPRNIEFVAHENTRTNMARMQEFKDQNAAFLPAKTFKDSLSLLSGKDRIELRYFGAGHTNGDAVIVFPALRTVVMGDLFARKWAPYADATNGGNMVEFPRTLVRAIENIHDVDTVITGHASTTIGSGEGVSFVRSNPVMKWSDLQEFAEFTREFVAAAQAAKKAGKSADEAAKTLNLPAKYRDYNMTRATEDVRLVYEESK
jgi:glyoxylase-like metal-dependent hydrolase (beta-lactamase superfamily II)